MPREGHARVQLSAAGREAFTAGRARQRRFVCLDRPLCFRSLFRIGVRVAASTESPEYYSWDQDG